MKRSIIILTLLATIVSCSDKSKVSDWADEASWYNSEINAEKPDIFYIVSTEVLQSEDGSYRSTLCEADRQAMEGEMAYVKAAVAREDFNFISPFYHQFSFDAISQPQKVLDKVFKQVVKEVNDAFDWYMANLNNGRPFVLAGFSQGAMLETELLKHMSDEQFSRMGAAYLMGGRVTEKDLKNAHINAAAGEEDTGVVIAFNSVLTPEACWPLVAGDAACCINPLNWKTDATPASFTFYDNDATVTIDPQTKQLVVETVPEPYWEWMEQYPFMLNIGVSKNCLHHWDLLFFTKQIHDNALKRVKNL